MEGLGEIALPALAQPHALSPAERDVEGLGEIALPALARPHALSLAERDVPPCDTDAQQDVELDATALPPAAAILDAAGALVAAAFGGGETDPFRFVRARERSPSPERFRPTKQVKLDERRLFVGGLPPHVADSQLIERFKRYGQVVEATALRGFGFVTFRPPKSARYCLSQVGVSGELDLDGIIVRVSLARARAEVPHHRMPANEADEPRRRKQCPGSAMCR